MVDAIMIGVEALPCLVCGRLLVNVHDSCNNQPEEGLYFRTYGAYGTIVFDPMDGHFLEINICDPCMLRARRRKRVYIGQAYRNIIVEGAIVGQEPILPTRMPKLRLWTEKDDLSLEPPEADVEP